MRGGVKRYPCLCSRIFAGKMVSRNDLVVQLDLTKGILPILEKYGVIVAGVSQKP